MPRDLSPKNTTGSAQVITRPLYLLDIQLYTPLLLSSRGDITFDNLVYESAVFELSLTPTNPVLRIFNDDLDKGTAFINQEPGFPVKIYQFFGEGPFVLGDEDVFWDGITGPASVNQWIQVSLRRHKPTFSPKITASDSIFSHLPPEGMVIQGRAGKFVLNRRS